MRSEVAIKVSQSTTCVTLPTDIGSVIGGNHQFFASKSVVLKESDLETQSAKFFNTTHEFGPFCIKLYSQSISIFPIQINGHANPKLQSFNFKLPSGVINNCFCVSELADSLIVDLILDINILITLNIPFNAFENGLSTNFNTWCKYQMPYPFERTNPLHIYALDYNQILFSTVDAGLFLMHRYNPLSDFKVSSFTNSSYLSSIKSKFFGASKLIKFNDLSVSLSSIIDIVKLSESVFVTIDVNKIVKFWDVNKSIIIKEFNLNSNLDESLHSAVLSPIFPNNILKFANNKLHIFLSLDNYYINVFNIDEEFNLDLADRIIYQNSSFKPIDYIVNRDYLYIVSVFSDTYFIQTHHQGRWENAVNVTKFKELQNLEFLKKLEHNDLDYAPRFIRHNFTIDIIDQALQLVNSKGSLETANKTSNDWIRFASICADLSNTDNKICGLTLCEGFLVLAKSSGFSIAKNLMKYEEMYFDKESDAGKLSDLLIDYSKGYESVRFDIEELILNSQNSIMEELFNSYISKISNEKVVSQLLSQLSSIPTAANLMETIGDFSCDFVSSIASNFTTLNENLLYQCLINNAVLGKKIVFGLLLLLGTLDYSEHVEKLFSKLRGVYKTLTLVALVDEELIIAFVKTYFSKLYFKNSTIGSIIDKVSDLLNCENFRYYVVCETQNFEFFKYLDESKISTLIKAIVLLEIGEKEEAKELFITNPDICEIELPTSKLFSKYDHHLNLILTKDQPKYFYNVSILFDEKKYYSQALEIGMKSTESIESLNKIFQLALKLKNYPIAFDTIKHMKHEFRISPLKNFIYKLLNENEFSFLIGQDYNEDYDRVDELVMELAADCEDVNLSKKFYRLVYSLRLKEGDFRGAVQALYAFGARQKDYGNFLVMLNLLKTLSPDDRWFVHDGSVINEVILQEEYTNLDKKLIK